jgi:hypothetical protein
MKTISIIFITGVSWLVISHLPAATLTSIKNKFKKLVHIRK